MQKSDEERYKIALRKTSNWQIVLLTALGGFWILLLLLFIGEVATTNYNYRETDEILVACTVMLGLACAAYFWNNLLQAILATKHYLSSGEEHNLLIAYKQQRLFWRNVSIMVGLLIIFIVGAFLFLVVIFGL